MGHDESSDGVRIFSDADKFLVSSRYSDTSIECNWHVQITTGIGTNSSRSLKYCGTNVPTTLAFDADVNLIFKSDSGVAKRGFKISYKVLLRKGSMSRDVDKE